MIAHAAARTGAMRSSGCSQRHSASATLSWSTAACGPAAAAPWHDTARGEREGAGARISTAGLR
jgi:hypothetical protein